MVFSITARQLCERKYLHALGVNSSQQSLETEARSRTTSSKAEILDVQRYMNFKQTSFTKLDGFRKSTGQRKFQPSSDISSSWGDLASPQMLPRTSYYLFAPEIELRTIFQSPSHCFFSRLLLCSKSVFLRFNN